MNVDLLQGGEALDQIEITITGFGQGVGSRPGRPKLWWVAQFEQEGTRYEFQIPQSFGGNPAGLVEGLKVGDVYAMTGLVKADAVPVATPAQIDVGTLTLRTRGTGGPG